MKKCLLLLAVAAGFIACNNSNTSEPATGEKKAGDSTAMTTNNSTESKQERNKKIIMASMQGLNDHNIDVMLKDASPDVVDYGDGSMKPVKGLDSCRAGIKEWLTAFPDVKGDNLVYAADGDWVMVWGDWTGSFKAGFMGMKPNNKSYKMKDVDIFKMSDDGKVLEHHNVQSPMVMMMQLGIQPPKK